MIDFNSHRTDGGTLIFRINGQLEHQSSEYFFECVTDAIEEGNNRIVISFADVGHISSVVLGGLIRASSCLLYTSPSPRDRQKSRMPSSA